MGEAANLLVHLSNPGTQARTAEISFAVTDYEDRPLALPPVSVEMAAGSSIVREITLPADWRGYYHVKASARIGERTQAAEARLAIVPVRRSTDTVCGINHAFPTQRLVELASRAGVSWYRDWSLKWQHMEPKPGEMHWEVADEQMDRVLKDGLSVLPLLPPFPSAEWNSEAPATMPTAGPGARIRQAWAPKDPQDLARYIGQAVDRYKDRIHVWEFLNEPLYTDYALPMDTANRYPGKNYAPGDYVKLLAIASEAMKSADPNCRVIGGLAGGPGQLTTNELIDAGMLEHLDILNVHMYPGLRRPETFVGEINGLLKRMEARGGRKPIWITEFSYYGTDVLPREPFTVSPNNWAEERLLASEKECAEFTARYFLLMLSRGVERIFIHSGASGSVNNENFECALFAQGGIPRKLLPVLAVMTDLLGSGPKPAGDKRLGESGWAVAFETEKDAVVALWATEKMDAKLPEIAGARWISAVGQELTEVPNALTTSPVYLVLPKGKAAEALAKLQ